MNTVPFAKPFFDQNAISDILIDIDRSLRGGWLTSGPKVAEFEQSFLQALEGQAQYAIAVNSCTAALHCILLGLGIGPGDEVILPSTTFAATCNAVLYVGAHPVLVDVRKDTFNIDPEKVREKITNKTRAIMPVHLAGNPCNMKMLQEIATDTRIELIEDCAHAHGAKALERYCGTFGSAAAFSFYPTKVMTSCEGGMIITNDSKIAEKARVLRNSGRGGYGPQEITALGYNYRMTDIHAIIGLRQLKDLKMFVRRRNELAEKYKSLLAQTDWISLQSVKPEQVSSYYAFLVLLSEHSPISRDRLRESLRSSGIETSILYHPLHLQPLYKTLAREVSAPVSEAIGERSLALPMWNGLTDDNLEYVARVFLEIGRT